MHFFFVCVVLSFNSDFGVQEPLAKAGFALLPPPECFEGDCLFDGITIADKIGWIPSECMPLAVDSILVNPSGALVLYFFLENPNVISTLHLFTHRIFGGFFI